MQTIYVFTCAGVARVRAWSQVVGDAYLAPFGLSSPRLAPAVAGTRTPLPGQRAALQAQAAGAQVSVADPALPFPIVCSTVLLHGGHGTEPYPYESTPAYSGCPPRCAGLVLQAAVCSGRCCCP